MSNPDITLAEPFDWASTILSQYANSPKIEAALESMAAAMDQSANILAFYNDVWNIETAQGYGLDVWGRIVVVSRTLTLSSRYFGFEQQSPDVDGFDQSPFYSGEVIGSSYVLNDDAYRQLIYAKALANITFGSVKNINAILQLLFPGRGPCYVTDNGDMTMTYTFGFTPTAVELAIIETSNVLPRPTGVRILYSVT